MSHDNEMEHEWSVPCFKGSKLQKNGMASFEFIDYLVTRFAGQTQYAMTLPHRWREFQGSPENFLISVFLLPDDQEDRVIRSTYDLEWIVSELEDLCKPNWAAVCLSVFFDVLRTCHDHADIKRCEQICEWMDRCSEDQDDLASILNDWECLESVLTHRHSDFFQYVYSNYLFLRLLVQYYGEDVIESLEHIKSLTHELNTFQILFLK